MRANTGKTVVYQILSLTFGDIKVNFDNLIKIWYVLAI